MPRQFGQRSAQRREEGELSRKGPNPKLYYKEFVKDGIEFWKKEKKLSFRLAMHLGHFLPAVRVQCYMSLWSVKPLVRDFWIFIGTIELLIPPGLTWNLHTTIIDATMRKKKKIGKYTFDRFLGAALGLKLIFWFLDVAAPLHIAALVFLVLGSAGDAGGSDRGRRTGSGGICVRVAVVPDGIDAHGDADHDSRVARQ